jgi:endonuclease/exonuclease/phosphatase family metal-dependent hydrolase
MLAAAATLVVVTFNLLHGGPWSEWTGDDQELERRFEIVATELARLHPDVLALQEASVGRRRGNIPARLAERLGMHYVHAPATDRVFPVRVFGKLAVGLIGFSEGPAILSRFPIVDAETIDLPRCRFWYDARVLLAATIRTPHGDVRAYSTHTSRDDCQLEHVAKAVGSRRTRLPSLLMGDLNTSETMTAIDRFRAAGFIDAFRAANPDAAGATVWQPVRSPHESTSRRVDYIFLLPGHGVGGRVPASRVVLKTPLRADDGSALWPSDHHGVLATVELADRPGHAGAGLGAETRPAPVARR